MADIGSGRGEHTGGVLDLLLNHAEVLLGAKTRYEKFHGVTYTDEALQYAVFLSNSYLMNRPLPDKALDLIKRLLTVPASGITLLELRSWWQFDPLRGDPRFQTILSSPEPTVIYR